MIDFKFVQNPTFILSKKGIIVLFLFALIVNIFWLYTSKITYNPNGKELYITGVELQKDLNAAEHFIKTGDYYFGKIIMKKTIIPIVCLVFYSFTYPLDSFLAFRVH